MIYSPYFEYYVIEQSSIISLNTIILLYFIKGYIVLKYVLLFWSMFYCSEICSIVLKYVLLFWSMFYCSEICSIVLKYVLLFWNMFYCSEVCSIVLKYVLLFWNMFYCSEVCSIVFVAIDENHFNIKIQNKMVVSLPMLAGGSKTKTQTLLVE